MKALGLNTLKEVVGGECTAPCDCASIGCPSQSTLLKKDGQNITIAENTESPVVKGMFFNPSSEEAITF